ncbi:MAG: TraR/DksA family transcriptional regulator [Limisphaerales bacterium]
MEKRKVNRKRGKPRARTQDVLAADKSPINPRWRKYYNRLMELRESYRGRQVDLAKDANDEKPTSGTHMADAGTDSYDRDFALGMLSSEQDALYEIDEALDRIRNGTYGTCEVTGKRIEAARLEAVPWTRFSADAERQLEREGGPKRARLGRRESVK